MKLLDETIDLLSKPEPVLADVLIKTKLLLHNVGRKDLAEWVNFELNGYPDEAVLPDYRIIPSQVRGSVTNGAYFYKDHQLPIMHLAENIRKRYQHLELRQSIAAIEDMSGRGGDGLMSPIPIELNGLFNQVLTGGYQVQSAWCVIGIGQLLAVKTQVRSRLLDFLLEFREVVGARTSDEDIKRIGRSPETASMFNNAIFGDNATIIVGHQNTQTVTNTITVGNFDALAAYLREHKVSHEDISNLEAAIRDDAEEVDTFNEDRKQFGPQVREWIKTMLAKAVDTSWQIEIAIAANLLTEGLKLYYGT